MFTNKIANLLLLGITLGAIHQLPAAGDLALEDLPQAVRATALANAMDGTITEIEKETHAGEQIYEIEITQDGQEIDLLISESGLLLGKESDHEEDNEEEEGTESSRTITLADLPVVVRKKVLSLVGANEILELERENTIYEATYEKEGREHSVKLTETASIVEEEIEIDPLNLPEEVRARIQARYPKGKIEGAEALTLYLFEVEVEQDGDEFELLLLANGQFFSNRDNNDDHDNDDREDD